VAGVQCDAAETTTASRRAASMLVGTRLRSQPKSNPEYLVGVGQSAPFDSAEWQSRVCYGGVRTREQAKVIELDVGEWRTDIDLEPHADQVAAQPFFLPAATAAITEATSTSSLSRSPHMGHP